jgi:acetolactate decarboxylase
MPADPEGLEKAGSAFRRAFPLIAVILSALHSGPLPALPAQPARDPAEPILVGAMKDVMWGGRLEARIDIDTLADKSHLYGLGPLEYLAGEILILDGKAYKAEVGDDFSLRVTETPKVRAPFFGYAHIAKWAEFPLPDSVATLPQLEAYLERATRQRPRPFFFRLAAMADSADIHVVNLPKGAKVSSPDDAHAGQREYRLRLERIEALGFFSTRHQAVFTHHDSYVHAHLITADRKRMGHAMGFSIRKGTGRLYLPE